MSNLKTSTTLSGSENTALQTIIETLSGFTQSERYKILSVLRERREHWFRDTRDTQCPQWDSEVYTRAKLIAKKLTDKGIKIALNQKQAMMPEVIEAYADTLRERKNA